MGCDASKDADFYWESPVTLHVYGLFTDKLGKKLNKILSHFNTGAFHVGVEVYGREWSYGESDSGVYSRKPGSHTAHKYQEAIHMGFTNMSEVEVQTLIMHLQDEWSSKRYDILRHNCCHFSNAFSEQLGVGPVPNHVANLARAAVTVVEPIRKLDAQVSMFLGLSSRDLSEDKVDEPLERCNSRTGSFET